MFTKLQNIIVLLLMLCICNTIDAQYKVQGKVLLSIDDSTAILPNVIITNKNTNENVLSDAVGKYSIAAKEGDTILFQHLSSFSYKYLVPKLDADFTKNVLLVAKKKVLTAVKVSGLTDYQKDSIDRADTYAKVFGYEQTATIMSPVSSLYEQFSKKYKDLRKFKSQVLSMEKEKYIDSKYTYELVSEITKLEGDSVAYFMNAYPMEYNFARTSGAVEIKMWVLHNFREYQKKQNGDKKN
jgi:hypothetical protein